MCTGTGSFLHLIILRLIDCLHVSHPISCQAQAERDECVRQVKGLELA